MNTYNRCVIKKLENLPSTIIINQRCIIALPVEKSKLIKYLPTLLRKAEEEPNSTFICISNLQENKYDNVKFESNR